MALCLVFCLFTKRITPKIQLQIVCLCQITVLLNLLRISLVSIKYEQVIKMCSTDNLSLHPVRISGFSPFSEEE